MVDIKTYGMSRCVINFLYSMGDMGYRRSSKTAEINPPTIFSIRAQTLYNSFYYGKNKKYKYVNPPIIISDILTYSHISSSLENFMGFCLFSTLSHSPNLPINTPHESLIYSSYYLITLTSITFYHQHALCSDN